MSTYSDNPILATDRDRLDRDRLVSALHELLSGPGLMTPLTVGVYGGWGTGKTSLMNMLRSELEAGDAPVITLWFDAWKYARSEESLWRALLLELIEALGDPVAGLPPFLADQSEKDQLETDLEMLRRSLYRSQTWVEKGEGHVNWRATIPFAADLALRFVGLSEKLGLKEIVGKLTGEDAEKALNLIEREEIERHREHVRSLDQFQVTLRGLVDREVQSRGLRLYIFVDDLDRCLPDEAVSALEAIKLFLDLEGCVFVLGMDRDVVERGILIRYPPMEGPSGEVEARVDPRQYLDKIIQLPLSLPPLTSAQIGNYLDDMLGRETTHPLLPQCRDLIVAAAPNNPRTVKRVLNVLSLLLPLDQVDDLERARRLAKIVLIQVLFDDTYREIVNNPGYLHDIEAIIDGRSTVVATKAPIEGKLKALLELAPKFEPLPKHQLSQLIAQTELTSRP